MLIHLPILLVALAASSAAPQDPIPVPSSTEKKAETAEPVEAKQNAEKTDDSNEAAKPKKDPAKAKGDNRAMAQQLANAESRHRVRTAKLTRLAEIAVQKDDAEMAARVAKLQKQNDAVYDKKLSQLNEKYGKEQVASAQSKVEKKKGKRADVAKKVKARPAKAGTEKAEASQKGAAKKAENAGKKANPKSKKEKGKPDTEVQR